MDKKAKKRADRECYFCGNDDYAVLDLHRITEGKDGGEYNDWNTLTVCCLCHRRIHDGQIEIDRKYPTSAARCILHYWEQGEEKWK